MLCLSSFSHYANEGPHAIFQYMQTRSLDPKKYEHGCELGGFQRSSDSSRSKGGDGNLNGGQVIERFDIN